jgi:hypothetical protein
MAARRHRSNKDVLVRRVILHANSITQNGAARKGRARVDAKYRQLIELLELTNSGVRERTRKESIT